MRTKTLSISLFVLGMAFLPFTSFPASAQEPGKWDHLDLKDATDMGEFVRIAPKKGIATKERYKGPVEITVVARASDDIAVRASQGASVGWNTTTGKMTVFGFDKATGVVSKTVPLTSNTWYSLRLKITEDQIEVAVDDKVVFSEKYTYGLSKAWPVRVNGTQGNKGIIDVKSLVVVALDSKQPGEKVAQDTAAKKEAAERAAAERQAGEANKKSDVKAKVEREEFAKKADEEKSERDRQEATAKKDIPTKAGKTPGPAKTPTEITADFLPHKPGTTMYYDIQMSYSTGKDDVIRVKVTQKKGGVIEETHVRTGVLAAGQSILNGDKVDWLAIPDEGEPSRTNHRIGNVYVEVGAWGENRAWVPCLKLGAKEGDTWRDASCEYKVKGFTTHRGEPAVVIEEQRVGITTTRKYVAGIGEVEMVHLRDGKPFNIRKLVEEPDAKIKKQSELPKDQKEATAKEEPAKKADETPDAAKAPTGDGGGVKTPLKHLDLTNAKVMDGHLRLRPESHVSTKESFDGPIDVVVVAKTEKNNIRLHAFNGACVIFNWEVNQAELRINRPDGNDNRESGSLAASRVQPLDANKWYTLRWRITGEGMSVAIDGKTVFSEKRAYSLSAKRPVIVASGDSVVDVKSFDVTRIQNKTDATQKPPGRVEANEKTPRPAKTPTEITADFLPHKPGTTMYYDRQRILHLKQVDGTPIENRQPLGREKLTQKDSGIIELQLVNESKSYTKYHRLTDKYIELGQRAKDEDKIEWEPRLKLGAKEGDTWRAGASEYTVKAFTTYNGKPAVVIEQSTGNTIVIYKYVAGIGEVEQVLHRDGKPAMIRMLVEEPDATQRKQSDSPKELLRLPVRPDTPGQVAVSPDGKLLASGGIGKDHNIYLHELPTGKTLHSLVGHTDAIKCVVFLPNSKTLLSGGVDGTVREWDVKTGQLKRTIVEAEILSGLGIVPDNSKLPNVIIGKIVPGKAADLDGRLKNGDQLTAVSGRDGKMVRVSDVPVEEFISLLSGAPGTSAKLEVVAGVEKQPRTFEIKRSPILTLNRVLAMSLSPDGKALAVGCTHRIARTKTVPLIRILEVSTGKELIAFPTNSEELWGLAFSPDGKLLASAGHKVAKVWDVATGKELIELKGHKMVVCSVAFGPDGKTLATVGTDKSVKMWKVPSWEEMQSPREQTLVDTLAYAPVVFSPDGQFLAVGGLGNIVQIWDTRTGKRLAIHCLDAHHGGYEALAFSPDSSLLAFSSSWDRRVHFFGWERPNSMAALVAADESARATTAAVDFSKLDYSKGPNREALQERKSTGADVLNRPTTEKGFLVNGQFVRHGLRVIWDSNNPKIKIGEDYWFDGELHGVRTFYYASGTKDTEIPFVNGLAHGMMLWWYEEGQKAGEVPRANGNYHGKYIKWYPNGQMQQESIFIHGNQTGLQKEWYDNGAKK